MDGIEEQAAYLGQSYDEAHGVIRVVGRGLWTVEHVDAHFLELGQLIDRVRARGTHILSLVDLSVAPVQPAEVAARITVHTMRIYRPDDRIAIVVHSSLVKMQMKRAVNRPNLDVFISPSAAMTWLTAHTRAAA